MNETSLQTACVLCLLVAMCGGSSALADDVAMVQPFIGETTALVLKVCPARLSLPDLSDTLTVPGSEKSCQAWTREVAAGIETLQAATSGQTVYATVGIPLSRIEWPIFLFLKETPGVDRKQFSDLLGAFNPMAFCARDDLIVAMPIRDADVAGAMDRLVPSPRAELADAFEAVRDYPIQVLLLPPDHVRRTVAELVPQLPRQLGAAPGNVLTEGLVWAALGMDPAQLRTELVVQSRSEKAAQNLAEHFPKLLRGVYDSQPKVQKRVPRETFESLLALVATRVDSDRFVLRLDGGDRLATIAAGLLHEMRPQRANTDNFEQILLAMHHYHHSYGMFPPQDKVRDKSGNSKLSWRVHILPFLREKKLYREFHLDEPWDSPHNKKLIKKMPRVYDDSLLGIMPSHTTFLAPVGEDTVSGGKKATRIRDITDGASNTVALVEVKPEWAVPWSEPRDYAFDPQAPGQGLKIDADGWFLAAFANGLVAQLRGNIEPELLLRLFQKSDGHPIDREAIQQLR